MTFDTELKNFILEEYILIPIYRQAFISAQGPRIANQWEEIFEAIPQFVTIAPYEDIRLKE